MLIREVSATHVYLACGHTDMRKYDLQRIVETCKANGL